MEESFYRVVTGQLLQFHAMTFLDMLRDAATRNQSMLCVGLDPDPDRFPAGIRSSNAIYDFCAAMVDATADVVCAFKPQIAWFAAHGAEDQLERLMQHIRCNAPHVPVILDAKRGDIGSTARQYAREAFERYGADAVTLSPFMGWDSIEPYLAYPGKGAFLLCRTSNPGGADVPAWHKGRGIPTASWAWSLEPPIRKTSHGCAPVRPACRCSFPVLAHKAGMPLQPCKQDWGHTTAR